MNILILWFSIGVPVGIISGTIICNKLLKDLEGRSLTAVLICAICAVAWPLAVIFCFFILTMRPSGKSRIIYTKKYNYKINGQQCESDFITKKQMQDFMKQNSFIATPFSEKRVSLVVDCLGPRSGIVSCLLSRDEIGEWKKIYLRFYKKNYKLVFDKEDTEKIIIIDDFILRAKKLDQASNKNDYHSNEI